MQNLKSDHTVAYGTFRKTPHLLQFLKFCLTETGYICSHETRFIGSKHVKNAFAAECRFPRRRS